jgi:hypothetical protein
MGAEMTFRGLMQPWLLNKGHATIRSIDRQAMACDSSKQLLLKALLKGLARTIRRDDLSAAERCCQRLRLTAEPIASDAQFVAKDRVRARGALLDPADVQRASSEIHLLPAKIDKLRNPQTVPVGHQDHRPISITVAGYGGQARSGWSVRAIDIRGCIGLRLSSLRNRKRVGCQIAV